VTAANEAELIQRMWFGTVEEAIEAVNAAATLGFGVTLHNESVPDEEEGTTAEQWIVALFSEPPTATPDPTE
jgi:hypothetical protein